MSLLPDGASFEERVQDYYLALRGSGLMLSALDGALLAEWGAQGVPFEIVARGIARAAEKALWDARPGEPVLRSLRACRRQVEGEIRRHLTRAAGEGAEPSKKKKGKTWEETRHARLRASVSAMAETAPLLAARARLLLECPLDEVPASPEAADAQETFVYLVLLRALPFAERRRLWSAAARHGGDAMGLSVRARKLARRFRLLVFLRRHLGGD